MTSTGKVWHEITALRKRTRGAAPPEGPPEDWQAGVSASRICFLGRLTRFEDCIALCQGHIGHCWVWPGAQPDLKSIERMGLQDYCTGRTCLGFQHSLCEFRRSLDIYTLLGLYLFEYDAQIKGIVRDGYDISH